MRSFLPLARPNYQSLISRASIGVAACINRNMHWPTRRYYVIQRNRHTHTRREAGKESRFCSFFPFFPFSPGANYRFGTATSHGKHRYTCKAIKIKRVQGLAFWIARVLGTLYVYRYLADMVQYTGRHGIHVCKVCVASDPNTTYNIMYPHVHVHVDLHSVKTDFLYCHVL